MSQEYKKLIVQERDEVMARLGITPDLLAGTARAGEDDQAQLTHDEFIAIQLNSLEYQKLQQLNSALQRISDGAYGICANCERPIPARRLQVIPWAEFCVPCQEEISATAGGDREESPFSGPKKETVVAGRRSPFEVTAA